MSCAHNNLSHGHDCFTEKYTAHNKLFKHARKPGPGQCIYYILTIFVSVIKKKLQGELKL